MISISVSFSLPTLFSRSRTFSIAPPAPPPRTHASCVVSGHTYVRMHALVRLFVVRLRSHAKLQEILRMMQASTGHPGTEHAPRVMYEDFMKLVPPLCPSQVFKVRGRGRIGMGGTRLFGSSRVSAVPAKGYCVA